ncbi:hypothetical protein Tco_1178153 [Tanacetum coccineum]
MGKGSMKTVTRWKIALTASHFNRNAVMKENILDNGPGSYALTPSWNHALPKFDQRIQETVQSIVPELIRKPLNKELNALNTLETQSNKLVKGDINLWEMMNLMKDMVYLLDSTLVPNSIQGEHLPKNDKMVNAQLQIPNPAQWEQQLNDDEMASVYEEHPSVQETTSSKQTPLVTEQVPPESTTLVVHTSEEKDSKEKVSEEELPSKRLNLFQTTSSEYSPTLHRTKTKGKGIATKEEPVKHLMPLIEQGGSNPKMLNLQQFSISHKKMKLEDAQAQLTQMKRKLGIPPPPELTAFGLFAVEKNRKTSSEMIKEVFVKEEIVVDGMHRNLIPPPRVEGSRGLVIKEPES